MCTDMPFIKFIFYQVRLAKEMSASQLEEAKIEARKWLSKEW